MPRAQIIFGTSNIPLVQSGPDSVKLGVCRAYCLVKTGRCQLAGFCQSFLLAKMLCE